MVTCLDRVHVQHELRHNRAPWVTKDLDKVALEIEEFPFEVVVCQ